MVANRTILEHEPNTASEYFNNIMQQNISFNERDSLFIRKWEKTHKTAWKTYKDFRITRNYLLLFPIKTNTALQKPNRTPVLIFRVKTGPGVLFGLWSAVSVRRAEDFLFSSHFLESSWHNLSKKPCSIYIQMDIAGYRWLDLDTWDWESDIDRV